MARITVEDCIDKFPSRFELVLIASNRARKLHSGENPTLERDNDKNTVIALREIAEETIPINELKNDLIEEYQTVTFNEDDELIENLLEENNDGNEAENIIDDKTNLENQEDSNKQETLNSTQEEQKEYDHIDTDNNNEPVEEDKEDI